MSKRAQLANGDILEFPDNTPDAVIDRVVKQHIQQAKPQAPRPTQAAKPQPKPSFLNSMLDSAAAVGGTLWRGAAAIPDMAANVGDAVTGGIDAVAHGRMPWEIAQSNKPKFRLADVPDMLGTARPVAPGVEFAGNVLGGAMVPGPKSVSPTAKVTQRTQGAIASMKGGLKPPPVEAPAPATPKAPPSTSMTTGAAVARPEVAALGREAAMRDARFRAVGVENPTTGMVTRDPRAWNFEREAAKLHGSGDQMLQSIKGVENDLANAARMIVDKQGGAIGAEATGQRVSKVLADKYEQMGQQVGALYTRVRAKMGDVRVPNLENMKAAQNHPDWADNVEFDNMSAQINKRLLRYAEADGGMRGLSVKQAEELRKFIGNIAPNTRQGYAMKRIFQDALDADVLDNVGGAPFAKARAAAAKRFDEFSNTFAGKVAAGDVSPERLTDRILSQSTTLKDLRAMRQSLLTGNQAAKGKEALNSVGAHALDSIFSKAISEDGKVNGTMIFKQFNQLAPRLQIILDPAQYKMVRRLAHAARDATAEVPFAFVNNSNTASAAANMFPDIVESQAGQRLLPNLARRVGGALAGSVAGGPAGAVAGDAAAQAMNQNLKARAAQTAAQQAQEQVNLAKDPVAAARFIASVADHPKANPVVRAFAARLRDAIEGRIPPGSLIPVSQGIGRHLNDNTASAAAASNETGANNQQQQQPLTQ